MIFTDEQEVEYYISLSEIIWGIIVMGGRG